MSLLRALSSPSIPESIPRQGKRPVITRSEVEQRVKDSKVWGLASECKTSDKTYIGVDISILTEFLQSNDVSEFEYIPESFDCDDFSFALQGDVTKWDSELAFGIVWITKGNEGHALNWCISTEGVLYFVEPQDNGMYKFEEAEDTKILWMAV